MELVEQAEDLFDCIQYYMMLSLDSEVDIEVSNGVYLRYYLNNGIRGGIKLRVWVRKRIKNGVYKSLADVHFYRNIDGNIFIKNFTIDDEDDKGLGYCVEWLRSHLQEKYPGYWYWYW